MKMLTCKDMGMECDFSAQGESAEEVTKLLTEHAAGAHAEQVAGMSAEDMQTMMTAKMTEV